MASSGLRRWRVAFDAFEFLSPFHRFFDYLCYCCTSKMQFLPTQLQATPRGLFFCWTTIAIWAVYSVQPMYIKNILFSRKKSISLLTTGARICALNLNARFFLTKFFYSLLWTWHHVHFYNAIFFVDVKKFFLWIF